MVRNSIVSQHSQAYRERVCLVSEMHINFSKIIAFTLISTCSSRGRAMNTEVSNWALRNWEDYQSKQTSISTCYSVAFL